MNTLERLQLLDRMDSLAYALAGCMGGILYGVEMGVVKMPEETLKTAKALRRELDELTAIYRAECAITKARDGE